MKKVNNKKGFTLAELLVVLAILAILVAVAIPIFTGAISNAEKTAIDANVRAIRAAAVTEILTDTTGTLGTTGPWYASATIGANGEMTGFSVSLTGSESIPTKAVADYVVKITNIS